MSVWRTKCITDADGNAESMLPLINVVSGVSDFVHGRGGNVLSKRVGIDLGITDRILGEF